MDCYVCGTPRPEGANYCPGCGRYCADDPNVRKAAPIPEEEILIPDPIPEEPDCTNEGAVPIEELPSDELPAEEVSDEEIPVEPAPGTEELVPETEAPEAPVAPEQTPERPVRKRKKHHPVLIPVLIMALLFTVGTVVWFAMPYPTEASDSPTETTAPSGKKPPIPSDKRQDKDDPARETYPATDDRCFRIKNGVVSFVPEKYDGSPILMIPSEIDGQTVTGIAAGGFANLEDVTTLVLPDTLETIGDYAFEHCTKLRGVYIPDSVVSVGKGAFRDCIDLESVSIPVATTGIGADAFDGCASLMYIFYEGTFEQWEALYNEYITPFTFAICSDGDYYHGAVTP